MYVCMYVCGFLRVLPLHWSKEFLTARPWAERGSCSAFGLLTARPWAERGSCSAFGLLTARPWAERGSCSAFGLLTARPWAERASCSAFGFLTARPWAERVHVLPVVYFFFAMLMTRPKLPLGQMSNHSTYEVYSLKAVGTLIHGKCYGYCFLYCM